MIHKAFIYIFRFGLIFCFVLTIGSGCQSCVRNKEIEELPVPTSKTPSDQISLLEKKTTTKPLNHSGEVVTEISDGSNTLQLLPKKKLKRVAKVEPSKQAIVLLHGLSRHSGDFDTMQKALRQKFPHANIIALTSVQKDSYNREKASSPSVKLSIKAQAKRTYEEIITRVPRGSHLVMVGHSQGGLRSFALIKEYGSRLKNEYGMVMHRLITIGTPWKGAPVFYHLKHVEAFNEKFDKIQPELDIINKGYSEAVRGYFFKKAPSVARNFPKPYQRIAPWIMKWKGAKGALDLDPESDFISHYVGKGLQTFNLPITAIAGVLTDFSKLFDISIDPQSLAKLNATYAELIGSDQRCDHDMLLPISTQHAEGLTTKDFKRIRVDGTCHGNKVGIAVKPGLSELNHKKVIEEVIHAIEATFYEQKEEKFFEKESEGPPAA